MEYPKGYEGFYMMKYEISQLQYCAFLNTLGDGQLNANVLSTVIEAPCFENDHIDGERNHIIKVDGQYGCDANGNGVLNESDDGQNLACNFLTWDQLAAYLDWSGMRPFTELEYEKACRGPEAALPLEFAWGTSDVVNTTQVANWNSADESIIDTIPEAAGPANFGYCLPSGPLRTGFAATATSDRIRSGASYYGIMELSGNLWELCVPVSAQGLQFTGLHGNGVLSSDGHSDVAGWTAGGHRGGGWNSGILAEFRDLAVSDRFFIYLDPNNMARGTAGGRGVISISMFE